MTNGDGCPTRRTIRPEIRIYKRALTVTEIQGDMNRRGPA
jgi:hypothetical protein